MPRIHPHPIPPNQWPIAFVGNKKVKKQTEN